MTWTHQPLQLAGSYLQKRFAGGEIFDDKASFEPPCPNIANLPFGFHQFIQLPAFDLAGCPDLVLTPLPVIQLVMPPWNTADLVDHG